MDQPAIDLFDVAKTYRRGVEALRGVAMRVLPREIFGLLGPNGAGKSTLVKILMTVIRPTRAGGTLLGRPLGHKPTLARVGYLPEHLRIPPYLTGRQAVEFFAALGKVDRRTRKRRAGEVLELVGMAALADRKLGACSKGMQQRIGLAQALAGDPQLVVMDEPTDGLDPVGRQEIRKVLVRLRDQGKTVFLNSHLLSEVERVCDRVAILVEGKIIQQGTIDELTARGKSYEIEVAAEPASLRDAIRAAIPGVCERPPGQSTGASDASFPSGSPTLAYELDGPIVRVFTTDAVRVQPVLDAVRRAGLVVRSLRPVRQSLEDFFIETVVQPPATEGQGGRP